MILTLYGFLGMVSGSLLNPLFRLLKIRHGIDGLKYYAEVHQDRYNALIHTIGMPTVIYGIYLWVPAFLGLTYLYALRIQIFFHCLFTTHYIFTNISAGIVTASVYTFPVIAAMNEYQLTNGVGMLSKGLWVSSVFLFFQEFIGHYLSSDKQSRLSAIPNALIYAEYFSIFHLVHPTLLYE